MTETAESRRANPVPELAGRLRSLKARKAALLADVTSGAHGVDVDQVSRELLRVNLEIASVSELLEAAQAGAAAAGRREAAREWHQVLEDDVAPAFQEAAFVDAPQLEARLKDVVDRLAAMRTKFHQTKQLRGELADGAERSLFSADRGADFDDVLMARLRVLGIVRDGEPVGPMDRIRRIDEWAQTWTGKFLDLARRIAPPAGGCDE